MKNPVLKAKLRSNGRIVEVYRLQSGGWCDFSDCTTKYHESQLEFIR